MTLSHWCLRFGRVVPIYIRLGMYCPISHIHFQICLGWTLSEPLFQADYPLFLGVTFTRFLYHISLTRWNEPLPFIGFSISVHPPSSCWYHGSTVHSYLEIPPSKRLSRVGKNWISRVRWQNISLIILQRMKKDSARNSYKVFTRFIYFFISDSTIYDIYYQINQNFAMKKYESRYVLDCRNFS